MELAPATTVGYAYPRVRSVRSPREAGDGVMDYIVVGGGSAGTAFGPRLSEDEVAGGRLD